jgi:hypothetical protein
MVLTPEPCIRSGRCWRRPVVSPPAPEQQHYWIIEPLLEAGLDLEQIRVLLFRLAFEAIVGDSTAPAALVGDQPPAVQAAWQRAIGRMIIGDVAAEWS